mgnify:CR=1 FL=1
MTSTIIKALNASSIRSFIMNIIKDDDFDEALNQLENDFGYGVRKRNEKVQQ